MNTSPGAVARGEAFGAGVVSVPFGQPGAEAGLSWTHLVLLSSRLLTDRMLLHTDCLSALANQASVAVWSTSADHPAARALCQTAGASIEPYPAFEPGREGYGYLRRLNDFAWDHRLKLPSRLSRYRHHDQYNMSRRHKVLRSCARALVWLRLEKTFEVWLERTLVRHQFNREAGRRFQSPQPTCVVATNPLSHRQPGTAAAAKAMGIPTLAMIPSWDNLSMKDRLLPTYDGYVVWSEEMRRQLYQVYPSSRSVPVYVCGAPQFDVFHQSRFRQTREEFCRGERLSPSRPIILYALGSPFLNESHNAVQLAQRLREGVLEDAQLLIRPHPLFDKGREAELLKPYEPDVAVQRTAGTSAQNEPPFQDEEEIRRWVNTFRHADVVVNLCSTATVDAAVCDRPVVNLDYDPAPGRAREAFIRDINHVWTHFKPVAESGGVWLAQTPEELVTAIRVYLRQPDLHRERRKWIVDFVCQYNDGRCGRRLAAAMLDFASRQHPSLSRRDAA